MRPYYIQEALSFDDQRTLAFTTENKCVVFDEVDFPIDTVLYIKDDSVNIISHVLDGENNDKYSGKTIEKRVYDLEGTLLTEEKYDLGHYVTTVHDYFIIDGKEYFYVGDENYTHFLIQYYEGEYKEIILNVKEGFYIYSHYPKESYYLVRDNSLYLFTGAYIYEVDLQMMKITNSFFLEDFPFDSSSVSNVNFSEDYLYLVSEDKIYIFDTTEFKLVTSGKHGVDTVGKYFSYYIKEENSK